VEHEDKIVEHEDGVVEHEDIMDKKTQNTQPVIVQLTVMGVRKGITSISYTLLYIY